MCIGFPMRVVSGDDCSAEVERGSERRRVSMLLVGAQPIGTSVLVHLDSAVRVLDPEEAELIDRALNGLEAASRGENPETYFDDLIDREPTLPAHLQPGGTR